MTVASVRLVLSEPEHDVDTKSTPRVGDAQVVHVPLLLSSQSTRKLPELHTMQFALMRPPGEPTAPPPVQT